MAGLIAAAPIFAVQWGIDVMRKQIEYRKKLGDIEKNHGKVYQQLVDSCTVQVELNNMDENTVIAQQNIQQLEDILDVTNDNIFTLKQHINYTKGIRKKKLIIQVVFIIIYLIIVALMIYNRNLKK